MTLVQAYMLLLHIQAQIHAAEEPLMSAHVRIWYPFSNTEQQVSTCYALNVARVNLNFFYYLLWQKKDVTQD